jgi:hypothetical protein
MIVKNANGSLFRVTGCGIEDCWKAIPVARIGVGYVAVGGPRLLRRAGCVIIGRR